MHPRYEASWRLAIAATAMLFAAACADQTTQPLVTRAPSIAPVAARAPYKSVVALEPLIGSGGLFSVANDVSDLGQVVGTSSAAPGNHAVIWDNSTVAQDLGVLPGGAMSEATAISADGSVIVGFADALAANANAVRWLKVNGQWTIDALPSSANCRAVAVSSDGSVIGGNCAIAGAVVWLNGRYIALGAGALWAVNKRGQAVGSIGNAAVLWTFSTTNITYTDLGTLGGTFAQATSINDAGDIAGWADNAAGETHAFLYTTKKGGMTDLGTPGVTSNGNGVNATGQVVGDIWLNNIEHAALFSGGKVIDLGFLPGYDNASARRINSSGVVVGTSKSSAVWRATMWILK